MRDFEFNDDFKLKGKVICHIPHSGKTLSDSMYDMFSLSRDEVDLLTERLYDKYVDELWSFVPETNVVRFPISRVAVDVERYPSDEDEPMSKLGMGWFYTHDDNGNFIREDDYYNSFSCFVYYCYHHNVFNDRVFAARYDYGDCVILDCHSFHKGLSHISSEELPDICLGYNGDVISMDILWMKQLFEKSGYTVKLNSPFSGSMMPSFRTFQDKEKNIRSYMIEINRSVCERKEGFDKVQGICKKIYEKFNK